MKDEFLTDYMIVYVEKENASKFISDGKLIILVIWNIAEQIQKYQNPKVCSWMLIFI